MTKLREFFAFWFLATLFVAASVFVYNASALALNDTTAKIDYKAVVLLNGEQVPSSFGSVAGFWFFAKRETPQVALMGHPANQAEVSLEANDYVEFEIPLPKQRDVGKVEVRITGVGTESSFKIQVIGIKQEIQEKVTLKENDSCTFALNAPLPDRIEIQFKAVGKAVGVRLELVLRESDKSTTLISLDPERCPMRDGPIECSPQIHPLIEAAMIEWDWRMHDGIGTPREAVSYQAAIEDNFRRGDLLAGDLLEQELLEERDVAAWRAIRAKYEALKAEKSTDKPAWEKLWHQVHQAKRALALKNPLFDTGPLLFCKRVPSCFTHQLAQYYGWAARPGGGLFVLEQPGKSMRVRCLTESLPSGAYLKPEVSYDGSTVFFSYCQVDKTPTVFTGPGMATDHRYHLYSVKADGTDVQQLTDGNFDDIQPIQLPGGDLIFSSTRRGGFHRCGPDPRMNYVLAAAEADGSNPHPISFHETNEWDPAVLHDGRVVYTRWDYVDRDAVYYQHLWSIRQDGSDVRTYYGNNTHNPLGIWETRPVPNSTKVMGTGGPHHAMSAGSIVLIDTMLGVDGPRPMKRLTPDALFPESEIDLPISSGRTPRFDTPLSGHFWKAHRSPNRQTKIPVEERRWPGHCYRSPWPLSENYFLAAYSYDRLRGEMGGNIPNMFGLYLVDSFGNRELIYRDPNIGSLWPIPLAARPVPPEMPTTSVEDRNQSPEGQPQPGVFALQNVYESWPKPLGDKVTHLRIIQLLPKATPAMDDPPIGLRYVPGLTIIGAVPAKQVLGTVPVEEDGSAYFEVPSKIPVLFQALDAQGRAVQTMRSITYLQPGEKSSCVGCHESRTSPPLPTPNRMAFARAPSKIMPGPKGSKPFSYPLLVQPVLDRHCVECHNPSKPEGKIILTSDIDGHYTKSYNALVPHIAATAWGMPHGNHEPMTFPGQFGARASHLVNLLDKGHYDVKLSPKEWNCLTTWIDTNGLFYGTYNREDQSKQRQSLEIAGPELE